MAPGSSQLSSAALRRLHRREEPPILHVENTSGRTEAQISAAHNTTNHQGSLLVAASQLRPPPRTCHQCSHSLGEDGDICPSCEARQNPDRLPVSNEDQGHESQRDSSRCVRSPSPELPRVRLGIPSNRITCFEQELSTTLHASPSQPPRSSSQLVVPSLASSSQQVVTRHPLSLPIVSSSHGEQIREERSPGSSQVTVDSSPEGSELVSDFDVPLTDHQENLGQARPDSPPLHITERSHPTPTPQQRQTVWSSSSTAERIVADRVASPEHRPLNQQIPGNQSSNTPLPPPPNSLPSASASQSEGERPMQRSDNFRRTAGSTNIPHLFRQDAIVGIQPRITTPPESP